MSFFGQEEQVDKWVDEGYSFIQSAIEDKWIQFCKELAKEGCNHATNATGVPIPSGGEEELCGFVKDFIKREIAEDTTQ